jgi:hypothetical protein
MLAALEEAHSKEWTTLHELVRVLIYEVNGLRLSYLASHGVSSDKLTPLVIPSPKDPPPERPSLRETARRAMAALRG